METIVVIIWSSLLALGWCVVFCLIHFFRLIKLGKVKDLSQKSGDVKKAVVYSNTAAMLPAQKESAYKHFPTFTAGVIYHLGTFLSLLNFVFLVLVAVFEVFEIWDWLEYWWIPACIACFLLVSSLCGLSLLLKRVFSKKLRPFSNFDDYFSNGIVTLFQLFNFALFAILAIIIFDGYLLLIFYYHLNVIIYGYFITAALLFLYLPFGKLKLAIYYFATRYHVGFFYGWRNAWPPKKVN